MKSPYPIMLELAGRKIAVIGGGKVAARKIEKLLAIGVKPTVVSPDLNEKIDLSKINWIKDTYKRKYVADMDLIIACTNDAATNNRVKTEADRSQLVNNLADINNSDFYNVATFTAGDLMISVSSLGKSPGQTVKTRDEIKDWLAKR